MKKILYALFLTFLLNACMQHYYVVRTEGTGIKGHYDKDKIIIVNISGRGDKDVAAIAEYLKNK